MTLPKPPDAGPDVVTPDRPRRRAAVRRLRSVLLCVALLAVVSGAAYAFLIKPEVRTAQAAACVRAQPARAAPPAQPAAAKNVAARTAVPLVPAKVTLNVYNATTRVGLAGTVATELRRRGFTVDMVDNDPLDRRIPGVAEVRRGPAGEAAAAALIPHLGTTTDVKDGRGDATVDVVVGARFTSLRAIASAKPATRTAAPAAC